MLKRAIMFVQAELKAKGLYQDNVDGLAGSNTHIAVDKGLQAQAALLPPDWQAANKERKLIFMFQLVCKGKGINTDPIDGYWGPVTEYAYDSLVSLTDTGSLPPNWRDEEPLDANPHTWPRDRGNQAEMRAFYGQPAHPPMKQVRCPWRLRLAWNTSQVVTTIGVHTKVADSVENVFARVHQHYGDAELKRLRLDLFGGCFAPRPKRGGSTWSTHAWAVAIDWDPARNQLKWGRERASLDDPSYAFWWKAWEEDGWVSLGRSRNFDWMHVQAARL